MRRYLVTFILLALPSVSRAEMVRFCYVPVDACGTMKQVPCGPDGSPGELLQGFGLRSQSYPENLRPTHMVTFRHPVGRNVTVPLTLPPGTPRMQTRADRIVYNFDGYTIEVRFFADGSVDVVYNSGFLRPLVVQ